MTKYKPLEKLTLAIDRLGINGEGIGRVDGYTIFVDFALPTETVIVELTECRKTFAFAKLLQIITPSKDRIEPICPVFGRCGGCQIMHLSYEKQLEMKRQRVVDAIERIGKLPSVPVEKTTPSPLPLHYRNKIQLPLSSASLLGLYAKNSHDIVPVETCYIHTPLGEAAFKCVQDLLKAQKVSNEDVLHVLIKTAVKRAEVLVVFITRQDFDAKPLAPLLQMPEIKGVVQTFKAGGNRVLGKEFITLYGQGSIVDELCGLLFKVSPASFFQVNPLQAENLYYAALSFADLKGNEVALDAYCGVGTLSLLFAKKVKKVFGVECVSEAIEDAKENARLNQITNAEFVCALAEDFIQTLENLDLVILNPPRKGCEASLIERLLIIKPKKIIYISCDPATLARDLALLTKGSYKVKNIRPFDMFPQTAHVESLAVLTF